MVDKVIVVGGEYVEENAFLEKLRSGDKTAGVLLAKQLSEDHARHEQYSLGLELLSRAFRGKVLSFLRFRMLSGDKELSLEVWNDAMYLIYTRAADYDSAKSSFFTWVVNQSRYAALTVLRRARKERAQPVGLPNAQAEIALPEPLSRKERAALGRAWDRLTGTEQNLLRWRYLEGYRHVEIGREKLDGRIPEEYVRVYVNRSARRLREFYEEELERE